MNVETKIIKSRLGLLNLVEELGNVSLACKYLFRLWQGYILSFTGTYFPKAAKMPSRNE